MRSAAKTLTPSRTLIRSPLPLSLAVFSQVVACTLVQVTPCLQDMAAGAVRQGLGAVMGFCHLSVPLLAPALTQLVPLDVEASLVQVGVEAVRQVYLVETQTTTNSSRLVLEVLGPLAEISRLSAGQGTCTCKVAVS